MPNLLLTMWDTLNSSNIGILVAAGLGMFAVIGGLAMLSYHYTLGSIKSRTVGDGQHGTARWATDKEIRKTYAHVPFKVKDWRKGVSLPTEQGLVLGCKGKKDELTALVDSDDIHCLMIAASGAGKTAFFLYAHIGSFSSYKVEHTGYSHFRREYGHFSGDSRREGDKTAPDCIGGSYLCLRCRQRRDRFCGTGSAAYGTKADRRQTPRPHACLHAAGGTVVAFGRHAGTVCLSAEGDPGWYRDLRAFGSVFSVPAPQVFLREDVYAFTYAGKGFVCRI